MMDVDEMNIDDFTLEELVSTASILENDLKRAREELDDSIRKLEYVRKKQKLVEIVNHHKELCLVKDKLSENKEEIKLITNNIRMIQNKGKLSFYSILKHLLNIIALYYINKSRLLKHLLIIIALYYINESSLLLCFRQCQED